MVKRFDLDYYETDFCTKLRRFIQGCSFLDFFLRFLNSDFSQNVYVRMQSKNTLMHSATFIICSPF